MKDYRHLLYDVATLLEEVLDSDWKQSVFSSEEVRELLEKINEMLGEIDDLYGS